MRGADQAIVGRLRRLLRSAADLVWPRQCQICGETRFCERFAFLCDGCFASVSPIVPPWCERCGLPFSGLVGENASCPNCHDAVLEFERARAAVRFRGVVRRAIHGLKYRNELFWIPALEAWFLEGVAHHLEGERVEIVVPVPLHPVRERQRGLNQAALLARALARARGLPFAPHVLERVRPTETQTCLDREERQRNLRAAFRARLPKTAAVRRVLLVDDVLTTGSTLSECAATLRAAGAEAVLALTLARG
ncbi:MAG: ComF family protein [Verrucomicrobiae bacterium]|nr:ComF family protein [Verrucomicrobiae bacterium]